MKIKVPFFLFLLAANLLSAQPFSNLYYDNRPAMLFGSIDVRNEVFYVTGVTAPKTPPYYRRALFGKISNSGNLESVLTFIDTNQYNYEIFSNSLKTCTDGNYYLTGNLFDSIPRAFFMKLDTAGTVKAFAQYSDTQTIFFQVRDVVEIPNQGFLIAIAMQLSNHNVQIIIIRTDNLGNELNRTIFGGGNQDAPWTIRPMLNGNYMVGAFTGKTTDLSPYWAKTWLIEMDSMGNMVKQWLDADNKNLWPRGMQQTADSGWIIVRPHLQYDLSNFQAFNASILKLDKNFNKQWEIDTGGIAQEAGLYDVEILPDGDYICCGANPIDLTQDSSHFYGWIMKVSSSGQILWERTYLADEHSGAWSFLYDIDVLPIGDLLACGEMRFTQNVGITPIQQGWILRTDSNGCELSSCVVGINTPKSPTGDLSSQIQVWPNPFSSELSITLKGEGTNAPVTFTITDMMGRVIYKREESKLAPSYTKMLDLSYLANGVYFVTVAQGGELFTRKVVKE